MSAAALEAVRAGGKAAAARALTALERAPEAEETVALLDAAWAAPVGVAIGLTGPPGVGKSTLIGALIPRLRARGRTVAVLAVDPSSRRSGGALLGDRTRFSAASGDAGVFVRSVAARESLGGLAETVWPSLALLRALFDVTLVETVGVGQSETEIIDTADRTALLVQPGAGDALQFMKAGVTEIPDLVAVTKGDLGPPAERAAAELRSAFALAAGRDAPPVSVLSSQSGEGVEAFVDRLDALAADGSALAERRARQAGDWAARALRHGFGAEGLALIRGTDALGRVGEQPFRIVKESRGRLRRALAEALRAGPAPRPPRPAEAPEDGAPEAARGS